MKDSPLSLTRNILRTTAASNDFTTISVPKHTKAPSNLFLDNGGCTNAPGWSPGNKFKSKRALSTTTTKASTSTPTSTSTPIVTEEGQLASSEELQAIFRDVFSPLHNEIVHAFGYGSGVFVQQDNNQESKNNNATQEQTMLDLILVVRDATSFHALNQRENPHHYAPLFRSHPGRAAWWQQHDVFDTPLVRNPKVFFNFVKDSQYWMKYGIITAHELQSDLQYWDSLYVGGRMHKPTATIVSSPSIEQCQQQHNLPAAMAMALLLLALPSSCLAVQQIPLPSLYSQISGLSYTGDFRMQMGAEDPGKINKLVNSPGQLERFQSLYQTPVRKLIQDGIVSINSDTDDNHDKTLLSWNPQDPAVVKYLWQQLPPRFQPLLRLPTTFNTASSADIDLVSGQLSLQRELHKIVAPAARYQSFKGIWTAGMSKSGKYALAKLSKGILRR